MTARIQNYHLAAIRNDKTEKKAQEETIDTRKQPLSALSLQITRAILYHFLPNTLVYPRALSLNRNTTLFQLCKVNRRFRAITAPFITLLKTRDAAYYAKVSAIADVPCERIFKEHIRKINLSCVNRAGISFADLATRLPNITHMSMPECVLDSKTAQEMATFSHLHSLDISCCRHADIAALQLIPRLRELLISLGTCDGNEWMTKREMKQKEALTVHPSAHRYYCSHNDVRLIATHLPKLQVLELRQDPDSLDDNFLCHVNKLTHLQKLSLDLHSLSEHEARQLAPLTQLKGLCIRTKKDCNGPVADILARQFAHLEKLSLFPITRFTQNFRTLRNLAKLCELSFSFPFNEDFLCALHFIVSFKNIKKLHLKFTSVDKTLFFAPLFKDTFKKLQHLTCLHINSTKQIALFEQLLEEFKKHNPYCRVILNGEEVIIYPKESLLTRMKNLALQCSPF